LSSLAWINDDSRGLRAIDISNPANPVAATDYFGGGAYPFAIAGDRLFRQGWSSTPTGGEYTLQAFDVSDPANPRLLAQMSAGAYVAQPAAITVVGNHAYLASRVEGLRIFRIETAEIAPRLSAEVTGNALRLRWPSNAGGFALESSTDPGPINWDVVPGTPPGGPWMR
jgi:hypothetical protein